MVGLGEHVQRRYLIQTVAARAQDLEVSTQGLGVAGNIGHPRWGHLDETLQGAGLAAGTGRVQDHHGGRYGQPPQDVLGTAKDEFQVRQPTGVLFGVGHGSRRFFHRNHLFHRRGQQDGEGAHAGVGV